MGVNKYASTFPMASCNKKSCNQRKRSGCGVKKIKKNNAIVFASTQLRITRSRKYPIDPKAYLGRCIVQSEYGAQRLSHRVSVADPGFLERGFIYIIKGGGVHFADFISFFLNIP